MAKGRRVRFSEINETRGESKIMYHGTSSTFLPQIMKFGLIPNPPEKVYDAGDWKSYGGIYLTSSKEEAENAATKAAEKVKGDEVVVAVQVNMKSTDTDEDDIGQLWSSARHEASYSWQHKTKYPYKDKVKKTFEIFYKHMNERKIKLNQKAVQILKDMEQYIMSISTPIGSGLEELTGAHPELRRMVDVLAQNMVYKNTRPRRVLQPIKFKGKTRIVKIWTFQDEEDAEQPTDRISRAAATWKPKRWRVAQDAEWTEIWPKNELKQREVEAELLVQYEKEHENDPAYSTQQPIN